MKSKTRSIIYFLLTFLIVTLIFQTGRWVLNDLAPAVMAQQSNTPTQSAPEPELGGQVVFPEGWRPIGCQAQGQYTRCTWLCTDDDGTYRYCKPVYIPDASEIAE